jgi:hypothetical protein
LDHQCVECLFAGTTFFFDGLGNRNLHADLFEKQVEQLNLGDQDQRGCVEDKHYDKLLHPQLYRHSPNMPNRDGTKHSTKESRKMKPSPISSSGRASTGCLLQKHEGVEGEMESAL